MKRLDELKGFVKMMRIGKRREAFGPTSDNRSLAEAWSVLSF